MVRDASGKGLLSVHSSESRHTDKHGKEHWAIQLTQSTVWVKDEAKIDGEDRPALAARLGVESY